MNRSFLTLVIPYFLLFPVLLPLTSFGAEEAAGATATKEAPAKIIFLGDSLTEGYGVPRDKAFPQVVGKLLADKGHSLKIINAGISGDTTAGGRSRIEWLLKQKPNYLFLALGANDGLRGVDPDSSKENLEAIIKLAKAAEVKVFLAGMQMPLNMGKEYRAKFEGVYKSLAKKHDVPLMPFLLEDVATVEKYNLNDRIHPNAAGYEIIGKNVAEFLEKQL